MDDRDGSGYVASYGDNAGERVMATAMAMETAMARATARATGMATARGWDDVLTAMAAGYGNVVAKRRTYLHRQLELFLSDTSCWIQKKYKKLKYIHT